MSGLQDQIFQRMAEIEALVKSKQNPVTELQWDDLVKQFGQEFESLVDQRVQEKMAAMPKLPATRRGGGYRPTW